MNNFEIDDTPNALDKLIDKSPSALVAPVVPLPSSHLGNMIELKAALDKAIEARSQIELELSSMPQKMHWVSEPNNFDELTRLTARRQSLEAQLPSTKVFEMKVRYVYHTTNIEITGATAIAAFEARERIDSEILHLQKASAQLETEHFNAMSERRDSTNALAHLNRTMKQLTVAENAKHEKALEPGAN